MLSLYPTLRSPSPSLFLSLPSLITYCDILIILVHRQIRPYFSNSSLLLICNRLSIFRAHPLNFSHFPFTNLLPSPYLSIAIPLCFSSLISCLSPLNPSSPQIKTGKPGAFFKGFFHILFLIRREQIYRRGGIDRSFVNPQFRD